MLILIGTLMARSGWHDRRFDAFDPANHPGQRISQDKNAYHHLFHILVSNIGSLTPLGDPPLFLGFLHGVPFFWTLKLFWPFVFCTTLLLITYYAIDSHYYRPEPVQIESPDCDAEERKNQYRRFGQFRLIGRRNRRHH